MATIIEAGQSHPFEFEWIDLDNEIAGLITSVAVRFYKYNGTTKEFLQSDNTTWSATDNSFAATALDGPTNLIWSITKAMPFTAIQENVYAEATADASDLPEPCDDFFVGSSSFLKAGEFDHIAFTLNGVA